MTQTGITLPGVTPSIPPGAIFGAGPKTLRPAGFRPLADDQPERTWFGYTKEDVQAEPVRRLGIINYKFTTKIYFTRWYKNKNYRSKFKKQSIAVLIPK